MTSTEIFSPSDLALFVAVIISFVILGFALVVLYKIVKGQISLCGIIAEPESTDGNGKPKASLSRFQFLVFTFVIAGLYLVLSLESGTFVDIPQSVLLLLGISGGSYLVSKGIGKTQKPNGGGAPKTIKTDDSTSTS